MEGVGIGMGWLGAVWVSFEGVQEYVFFIVYVESYSFVMKCYAARQCFEEKILLAERLGVGTIELASVTSHALCVLDICPNLVVLTSFLL